MDNNNNIIDDNEKLFWKIIKNKLIFKIILLMLSPLEDVKFKKLEDFLNFNQFERLTSMDIHDKKILNNLSSVSLPSLTSISLLNFDNDEIADNKITNKMLKEIPSSVTKLNIKKLDSSVKIPQQIKHLRILNYQHQLVNGFLPSGLETLVFLGGAFNQNITEPDVLPNSLKYLDLGKGYQSSFGDNLPNGLHTLKIGYQFGGPLYPGQLKNIKRLILEHDISYLFDNEDNTIVGILPNSLEELEILGSIPTPMLTNTIPTKNFILPISLRKLLYSSNIPLCNDWLKRNLNLRVFHFIGRYEHPLNHKHFNDDLETLILSTDYTHQFDQDSLPKNLKTLIVNLNYSKPILPNTLPSTLTHLDLNNSLMNHPLQIGSIPKSVTFLKLPQQFNFNIPLNLLPVNLEYLSLGYSFNKPLQYCLPPYLKVIQFSNDFNQPLEPNTLPPTIESILFGLEFNQDLLPNSIPENTKFIHFSFKYNKNININKILPNNSIQLIEFGNIKINFQYYLLSNNYLINPNLN